MSTRRHHPTNDANYGTADHNTNQDANDDSSDIFRSHPETVNLIGLGNRGRVFLREFMQSKDLPPVVFIGVDAHAPDRLEVPRDEDHYNRLSAIPDYLRQQLLHTYGWALRGAAALFIAQEENPPPVELEEAEALTVLAQDRSIAVFRIALRGKEGSRVPQPPAAKALQQLSDATLALPYDWQGSPELQAMRWLFAALLHLAQEGMMVWQSWDMFDVQEVLCTPGTVLYAMTAEAIGANRAEQATQDAIEALTEQGVESEVASGVLLVLAAGEGMHRLRELRDATDVVRRWVGSGVFILPLMPELGYDSPEDVLTVTVAVSVRMA
ncbi:hypothetical protein [uncultured Xylophilus sp.]|uniref:hypothetical protein n=1 Tax=uncultured Xylophilus sp. TaxID=296832 RepID=UPI0025E8D7BE|nr:hypothetical protein [uncultured Xylophilus sp.]